jgi:hypothetical protein
MSISVIVETEFRIAPKGVTNALVLSVTEKGDNVIVEIGNDGQAFYMNKFEFIENMNEVLARLNGEK